MKNILLLFILFTSLVSWGQRVNIDELTVSNNTYSFNGNLYNGSVYVLYDSGQLKEGFKVKNGKIEGKMTFYRDDSFVKERYKDTTLIKQLEDEVITLNDELISLKKDSSANYNRKRSLKSEMGDKFYKYKEKYNEGKLKGNKLELYEDYLIYTKNLKEKTLDVGEKRIERNKVEQKLNTEKNKSEYSNKKKDVYQYSNGLCSLHKEYDKYEKLFLEEELKDGIRNGSYKRYENGKIKEEGTYLNNKKDGLWTIHSYNGKEEITYSNDVKDGQFKKYDGDVIVEQGNFINGLMNGEWIFRWDNGNLKSQGNYIDGDGILLDFQKTKQNQYSHPLSGRDGLWLTFYESGVVSDSLNYSNGNMDGIHQMFHENGQLWVSRNYEVVDGKSKEIEYSVGYDVDGNKTFENIQVDDNKWTSTWFYPNGNKREEFIILNGTSIFDGNIKTVYDTNGKEKKWKYDDVLGWREYMSPEEADRRLKELYEENNKIVSCSWCGREFKYGNGYKGGIRKYSDRTSCTCNSLGIGGYYCSPKCSIEWCKSD